MKRIVMTWLTSVLVGAVFLATPLQADSDESAIDSVLNTLDYYMQAGVEKDARRGAELLLDFDINARRAEYDTGLVYRKRQDLFESYVSISNDLYGYEIQKGLLGTTVELEGSIQTTDGATAEFKARLVHRKHRWLIADLKID